MARWSRRPRGSPRIGEDVARDGVIVCFLCVAADIRRADLALVVADGGQLPDAGDVANCPQWGGLPHRA